MTCSRLGFPLICAVLAGVLPALPVMAQEEAKPLGGVVPSDADGRPLNLGFETGTLDDWIAEGDAFRDQPIEGDTVSARRSDMVSNHAGRFWVGTFERSGDEPKGTLTSVPFVVSQPFASFLLGGGAHRGTRVELRLADSERVIAEATGENAEDMSRVVVDLSKHQGERIQIRLVDDVSGGWGHLNFDDFRLHEERPNVPARDPLPPQDQIAHAGLTPEESAAAMTVPEGFRVTLAAGEPDVVRPIALAIDDRGRVWVLENHTYPFKAPEGEGKDRILIFEDEDGDGRFDSRKVFHEGLNMATGLELGFGGVWVGAAPELLFIPDRNGDDVPDGEPVVLLDGWGLQDTHETLNSFTWGPDGWLYGCHGVFTHSKVGKPGTPDEERIPINAGVWRYHPTKHEFEVFAHGTSNPWGVDFDQYGNCFITACVIPHLYHMIPGGRYQRQAGQHFNPYTYDDIKTIGDHVHYLGRTPHSGNDRSDAAGGGHAHSGLLIYQGDAWPEEYRGSLLMNNIHGARLNRDLAEPSGSGFIGRHAPDFLLANDRASQILAFKQGPDGNVWMIDWYDLQQCHVPNASVHDRSKGRIFKVSYGDQAPAEAVDLRALGEVELSSHALQVRPIVKNGAWSFTEHLSNPWAFTHARRLLQERGMSPALKEELPPGVLEGIGGGVKHAQIFHQLAESVRLRCLWLLHTTGGLDEAHIRRGLTDEGPHVRSWTIRLTMEDRAPSDATLATFVELAKSDPSPVVRLELASALQRMPVDLPARWDILEALTTHAEDADDHNIPLMLWYALEPAAASDPGRALSLASRSPIPRLLEFTVRRIGAIGTNEAIAMLVDGLASAESMGARKTILGGINEALRGRRQVPMPERWPAVFRTLLDEGDADLRSQGTALALTFGDASARDVLLDLVTDRAADPDLRREALEALRRARAPGLAGQLRHLIGDPAVRGPALRALADFDDVETPESVLEVYPDLPLAEKRDALNTLASRPFYARALLDAVGQGTVAGSDLSADLVRQLRNLDDEAVTAKIAEVWGTVRDTPADRAERIATFKGMLTSSPEHEPDVALGRAVFVKTCAQCHVLFEQGGNVGPELTGSNRADLDYILSNVLDPSALIGKDYQAHLVATSDGRILTGIIKGESEDAITLLTANETITIPQDEVEERQLSDLSMMPDDLWANVSNHEIRSLVAYLASPSQVPVLLTQDTAQMIFNGEDLTGWVGNPALWSVENGEIVGKTDGLRRNEFLRSELVAGDFRLTLEVKLTPNAENSGIQFRSEPLPEGEVKGYQADIGAGWWGKLYEEHGRGLLWDTPGDAHVKLGEWNTYEIIARGSKITTSINGKPCVDLDDPEGSRRGIFALQLHSGGPMEVRFRNLVLEPLD
ncbi:PVC-type heme-binding CxxCH protein [Tautonia marina]|uniref:PVC-type heme-binding CxxCH protein n=1 Tax=Tautonia marina TaxID=2653855 RepID=UPI00126075BE|nr:PVC-type heme-binding CxxCH protein [Tautonia marina]